MTEALPTVFKQKPMTVAERAVWMSRTSDVLGSHLKTDLDSYLSLIRRKIQEKCSSTQELIYHIRRTKIGEGAHVTPNEFRFTLIKFGVILSQPLVDRVFAVFDSDRSGTMDFDEFAMWIMNSEFQPKLKDPSSLNRETVDEIIRKKILHSMETNPNVFAMMKAHVTFSEFLSDFQRLELEGVTDRDIRGLFLLFDHHSIGFVEASRIKHWIKTGHIMSANLEPVDHYHLEQTPQLSEAIHKVSGRNSKHMEQCFHHIPKGQGIKIPFEEFRRCLLRVGLGKNLHDTRHLFHALGGKTGVADVDLLLNSLTPMPHDYTKEINEKKIEAPIVCTSRADRHLREAMRKAYKEVRRECENHDTANTGFLDVDVLHDILTRKCLTITFLDFRYIIQQLKTINGGAQIDWRGFLEVYDPRKTQHVLDGISKLRVASQQSSSTNIINNTSDASEESTAIANRVTRDAIATKDKSGLFFSSNTDINAIKKSASFKAFAKANSIMNRPNTTSNTFSTSSNSASELKESNPELRRVWQHVLRECRRCDPERSGLINRVSFINALNSGAQNTSSSVPMTAEYINQLADEFSSKGLVDYTACFRKFLNGMVTSLSSSVKKHISEDNNNAHTSSSSSMTTVAGGTGGASALKGAIHPWEFDYKRERHPAHPYWHSAASQPKETAQHHGNSNNTSLALSLSSSMSSVPLLTSTINQPLSEKAISGCKKCFVVFQSIWKDLRNDFKRGQINSNRGCILANNFVAILNHYGVNLLKSELAAILREFRGLGMQTDVVRFDDFLKACLMTKKLNNHHTNHNNHNNQQHNDNDNGSTVRE